MKKLQIPFGLVINRADVGYDKVDQYCEDNKIHVLMRIPFSSDIARAYAQGIPMVKALPEYKKEFRNVYREIKGEVK